MITVIISVVLLLFAIGIWFFTRNTGEKLLGRGLSGAFVVVAVLAILWTSATIVPASHTGVVVLFGQVQPVTLTEGLHFVNPLAHTKRVFTGIDVAQAEKSEAGSRDLQSVHATLTVNYQVDQTKVRELYQLNPSLGYEAAFVVPATFEVFKAVVSQYTAEELVTKRAAVSENITRSLNAKLAPYFLHVQSINLVNFGFSRAFDAAIEEKVTANQKAATAENNLKRVKFEADARITQAEGEAKAIAIQAAAVEKQGGAGYIQLEAIKKWDGKLPSYMTSGASTPFVSVGK